MSKERLKGRDQDGSVFPLGMICLRQVARRDSYADGVRMHGHVVDALKCPLPPVKSAE
jgi:hypothetical protein